MWAAAAARLGPLDAAIDRMLAENELPVLGEAAEFNTYDIGDYCMVYDRVCRAARLRGPQASAELTLMRAHDTGCILG